MTGIFGKLRVGMNVFDRSGDKIGIIRAVEPGQIDAPPGLLTYTGGSLSPPGEVLSTPASGLPMVRRHRLRRKGYIQIGSETGGKDLFEPFDAVGRVAGSIVRLSVKCCRSEEE
ncbi:hypothetical protein [Arthrobacter zhaoguopingii]|uniref:hypothetical protein n=1 Tax=Arthrobacter zhaoguopingii TaxID=2681491 RepID=UPI00135A6263|nr:hypothetical protein [Arthrobacter zhaoguopingii]